MERFWSRAGRPSRCIAWTRLAPYKPSSRTSKHLPTSATTRSADVCSFHSSIRTASRCASAEPRGVNGRERTRSRPLIRLLLLVLEPNLRYQNRRVHQQYARIGEDHRPVLARDSVSQPQRRTREQHRERPQRKVAHPVRLPGLTHLRHKGRDRQTARRKPDVFYSHG